MDYLEFRKAFKNRNSIFMDYNGADGTTSDNTTDAVITRDPNNYLLPKVNSITITNGLIIAVGVLAVVILTPIAIKSIKQYV